MITLTPIASNLPEIIPDVDFYACLNTPGSVKVREDLITLKEKQYRLSSFAIGGQTINGYHFQETLHPQANGQTSIQLAQTPDPNVPPLLTVNGMVQELNVDYTISGSILNWISPDFTLSTTDQLIIYYS
jgi:hypothetical protein